MPLPFASVDPPPPVFTIGALAIAARRANAVGAVRITVLPARLEIELIHIAGFAEGFAPGAIADPVCFQVPYLAVRGLVQQGRMLYLTLDPTVCVPYNRFALVRFSDEPAAVLARAFRARLEARWANALLPGPIGLIAALLAPSSIVSGWLGRTSLGLLVALAAFVVLREIVAFRTWGGPISDHHRDVLEAQISSKLGLAPPEQPAAAIPEPARATARPEVEAAPSPIGRVAIAVALAAAGVVGAMAFLQQYAAPQDPPPAVPLLVSGISAVALRARPGPIAADGDEAPDLPRCSCVRADSPLWKDGVPVASILMFHGESEAAQAISPREGRGGAMRYDFDLAVVNNGDRPQQDLRVTLTFARRNKRGRRVGAVDRGLFWGGALAPGRAVKWRVSAPGTEMRVDPSVTGTLDQARLEPAPPDAFFALMSARFRAVRVHGATMLAYLRDPRADDAIRELGAGSGPEEQLTLDRLRRAAAPVFACGIKQTSGAISACIFNGSSRPQRGLEIREVLPGAAPAAAPSAAAPPSDADPSAAADAPPAASGDPDSPPALPSDTDSPPPPSAVPAAPVAPSAKSRRFAVKGVVPTHEGVEVSFPLEGPMPEEWVVIDGSSP